MRVLFVSQHFPEDPSKCVHGVFQRMRMSLDAVVSQGGELDILFYPARVDVDDELAARTARRLREDWGIEAHVMLCGRNRGRTATGRLGGFLATYLRPALRAAWHPLFSTVAGEEQRQAFLRALQRRPDMVFFHRLDVAGLMPLLPREGPGVLLDLDDIEHRKFLREIPQPPRWRGKPLLYMQLPALFLGERAAIRRSDRAFVCSEEDRRYLARLMQAGNVEVIPNTVPLVEEVPPARELNVLFVGSFGYAPNVVAAEYLIREVWPRLSALCPGARLLIAGPDSDRVAVQEELPGGVELLGFVPDLAAVYRHTRVVCCPIWSGGGTRIKILEAGSFGVPVVSTPLGAEGLALEAGTEIVLGTDADTLARACADLLQDGARAAEIGSRARERIRSAYSRDKVVARIGSILSEVALSSPENG